jgi:membrane protein implicated in regulation of membrane protease activity
MPKTYRSKVYSGFVCLFLGALLAAVTAHDTSRMFLPLAPIIAISAGVVFEALYRINRRYGLLLLALSLIELWVCNQFLFGIAKPGILMRFSGAFAIIVFTVLARSLKKGVPLPA